MFDAITTRPLNPTFVSAHARPPLTKDSNERDASFFFFNRTIDIDKGKQI